MDRRTTGPRVIRRTIGDAGSETRAAEPCVVTGPATDALLLTTWFVVSGAAVVEGIELLAGGGGGAESVGATGAEDEGAAATGGEDDGAPATGGEDDGAPATDGEVAVGTPTGDGAGAGSTVRPGAELEVVVAVGAVVAADRRTGIVPPVPTEASWRPGIIAGGRAAPASAPAVRISIGATAERRRSGATSGPGNRSRARGR